jgi:hypothetical protein
MRRGERSFAPTSAGTHYINFDAFTLIVNGRH